MIGPNGRSQVAFRARRNPPQAVPASGPRPGSPVLDHSESTQIQVRRTFEREFADGAVIFDEGDEGSHLYVIQSGQVEICRQSRAGKRVVAKLGPGEFFGEMSVVLGEPRTARAISIGPSELLELDGATLESMCIEQPEIAIRLIQRLALRLIAAERRLAVLGLDELVAPLIRYLIGEADVRDCEDELHLETSLRALADGAQLSLHETYQALHQLMDQKLVRVAGDAIVVPDCAALGSALTRFSATA